MELDVVGLPAGERTQYLVVPLRQDVEIHELLKCLTTDSPFARDPPDIAQLTEEIAAAFESGSKGLEIH